MAVNYSQSIKNNVQDQKTSYVENFFSESEAELTALGLPNSVYYRDLYFDIGSGEIREVATNNRVQTLPMQMRFRYQKQGVQLYVMALNYNYYPV